MPAEKDIALMAHLMRRAGFGANKDELETYVAKGYEATVEDLLNPPNDDYLDRDVVDRYYIEIQDQRQATSAAGWWLYRMINTRCPLQEKMTLFWHGLFATAYEKIMNGRAVSTQIEMFRRNCLTNFSTILLELSRDPAMIIWLDNNTNHKDAPNENYGRELLELFSMGVGNYTEEDVKECTRAFTGWTISNLIPRYPWGAFPLQFEYRADDHDDEPKEFLGKSGHFNGDDIIEIIVSQPATAKFITTKLYNFFVSDDPPCEDEIKILSDAYLTSGYDIKSVMRVLLNSDFFKNSRFTKVKSPTELVAGVLRLVGNFTEIKPGLMDVVMESGYMGQELLNPPTVEGWHTGKEWIDSGSLVGRVNFASEQVGNIDHPGVRSIVDYLASQSAALYPEDLVDGCLELLGPMVLEEETRKPLVAQAKLGGILRSETDDQRIELNKRVLEMLQLIVSTREFQFA